MATRKRKAPDIVAIENLVASLFDAQATLNGLTCPICKCQRLSIRLISHVGIVVQCEGLDDSDQATPEGECTYDYLVRRAPGAATPTKLVSLTIGELPEAAAE